MVVVNVDIPALNARHPLGDTVEASGVRLRGRGRVRQGVCPFHDEADGNCRRPSRGWTAAQGLHPGPLIVQPERGVLRPPRWLPATRPATAAARFYAGRLRRSTEAPHTTGTACPPSRLSQDR